MKSLTSKKDKEVIIQFLETYKKHRCLWDVTHKQYSNRNVRNIAYNHLLKILKKVYPEATIDFLKKKIENMRSVYKRETRKIRVNKHTGAGAKLIYRPRLWYYEMMAFLDENETGISEQATYIKEENESDIDIFESSPILTDNSPQPPLQEKRKKTLELKKTSSPEKVQEIENHVNVSHTMQFSEDQWEIIGKSIGLQLKQLNDNQQTIANKLIAEIIFYGKRNRLTDSSTISLS